MDGVESEVGRFETDMAALLESGEGADVTLVVGASQLPAHSTILAARSPVFAAMLRSNMREARSRRIEIVDVQEDALWQLLCFVYTDTAPELDAMPEELLAVADKYDLPLLKRHCEDVLTENLTVDNAAATAHLAVMHSCSGLQTEAADFIACHPNVMLTDGWANVLRSNAEAAAQICRLVAVATEKIRMSSVEQKQDLVERLAVAARMSDVSELRRLLAAGAAVNARDGTGLTALHLAAMDATAETVKCLVDAGADVNVKDSSLQTPLHAAAYRGNVRAMWVLLAYSARVEARDRWGKTPLHWAAATKQAEAVRTLLLAGASKTVKDVNNVQPIDVATAPIVDILGMY